MMGSIIKKMADVFEKHLTLDMSWTLPESGGLRQSLLQMSHNKNLRIASALNAFARGLRLYLHALD